MDVEPDPYGWDPIMKKNAADSLNNGENYGKYLADLRNGISIERMKHFTYYTNFA